MADLDPEVRYTVHHQWLRLLPDNLARIGISDFAQDSLGDVISVSLPSVGDAVVAGEPFGEVESTKSESEVYAPVSGTVTSVNDLLSDSPEVINDDPYGDGWLLEVRVDPARREPTSGELKLLTSDEYQSLTEG
ncbi:glycine cleavage system protein GcvH [Amycolatopsis sp. NPDC051372]|uniref:glycine cleavage system protein GcvH n=1 Tax=unclassified Amycolatopsis TaxID=2618356 RepID=UPI003439C7FA